MEKAAPAVSVSGSATQSVIEPKTSIIQKKNQSVSVFSVFFQLTRHSFGSLLVVVVVVEILALPLMLPQLAQSSKLRSMLAVS